MLITCSECQKEFSDTLTACPHCGFVRGGLTGVTQAKVTTAQAKQTATFQYVSLAAVAIALFTPRILLAIPCLAIISCGIIALIRREPRWPLSAIAIVMGFLLMGTSSPSLDGDSSYISNMRIENWNWEKESSYSYVRGRVTNTGQRTVSYFSITAQYKDASSRVLDTDYTNSGQDLGPGMSKEFQIMHKSSPEYTSVSVVVDRVSLK